MSILGAGDGQLAVSTGSPLERRRTLGPAGVAWVEEKAG